MENKFISIKEACNLFNKSNSTIRRVIKESPENQLKKEKLKTGHYKIFISVEYLNQYFNGQLPNNDSNELLMNNSNDEQLVNSLNNTIDILKKELENKNNTIESLIERQRESNIIIERLNQKILIEPQQTKEPRKWWQLRNRNK